MLTISLGQLIALLLLLQCLVMATYLWYRKSAWPLAVLLLLLAAHMAINIALSGRELWFPDIRIGFAFCYGPLLYALARHFAWRDRAAVTYWHFFPALIFPLLHFYFELSYATIGLLVSLTSSAYVLFAFVELRRFHSALQASRATFEAHSLMWLRDLLIGFLLIAAVDFLRSASRQWSGHIANSVDQAFAITTYGAALLLLYYLVWRALQQSQLFDGLSRNEQELAASASNAQTFLPGKSGIGIAQMVDQLETHLNQHHNYLQSDLTVQELATQLGWHSKTLSALLNQHYQRNFNDFINQRRVAWACALLRDRKRRDEKLISIQLDSGFASKSVFNASFKRVTGQSPSAYRAQQGPES